MVDLPFPLPKEIRVTTPLPVVVFCAAFLRKRPADLDGLNRDPSIRLQGAQIISWCRQENREVVGKHLFSSTSRSVPFVRSEQFKSAVDDAKRRDCALALGSVEYLLSRSEHDRLMECVVALDACPVPIVDTSLGTVWQSMPDKEKNELVLRAASLRAARSRSSKTALARRDSSSTPRGTIEGRRRGAATNAINADRRAKELADFVSAERAKLPDGIALTPTALKEALNAAAILTSRGKAYTFNAAKNLLARVDSIGAVSAND